MRLQMRHFGFSGWMWAVIVASSVAAPPARATSMETLHEPWKRIVEKRVTTLGSVSQVDYKRIKAEPAELDFYLKSLSAVSKEEFNLLPQGDQLAFLINAYNAYTVKLVADNYPVSSIKKIGGLFGSPWKIEFFSLLGEKRSLDKLEHGVIRKLFNEPRVHVALVCASKGCPALRAYSASKLESELEDATQTFLRDPQRNRFDPKEMKLHLGKIFDWYQEDFVKKAGSLKAFIAPRMSPEPEVRKKIEDPKTEVEFLDYDWSLNDKARIFETNAS